MKKILSGLLAGMLLVSSSIAFAGTVDSVSSATEDEMDSISSATRRTNKLLEQYKVVLPFKVAVTGNVFELKIKENPTTGYEWQYKINDTNHVKFIQSDYKAANTTAVGAGGEKMMTFEVLKDGVSTITLSSKRPWEKEVAETIEVLVYKNGSKVIVEEDKIVTIQDKEEKKESGTEEKTDKAEIMDGAVTEKELSKVSLTVKTGEQATEMINKPVVKEGVLMLPLAESLRALGYEVKWNSQTASVDVMKGAQWTSVKGGVNAYTKNKMAPMALSAAPTYIEGVTYVPAEFFSVILNLSFGVDSGDITLSEGMMAIHEGFVKEIAHDETGTMTITLSKVKDSDDIGDLTVIHTSKAYTYYQKEVKVGERIKVVSPPMMTMSLPGQTSGHIVY